MIRNLVPLLLVFALVFGVATGTASAQTWGGYGAGFAPSPQPVYAYGGQVVGVMPAGYGYGMGYGGYGYGGYGFGGYGGSGFAISSTPFGTNFSYYQNRPYYGGYGYSGGGGGYHRHHRHR